MTSNNEPRKEEIQSEQSMANTKVILVENVVKERAAEIALDKEKLGPITKKVSQEFIS